MKLLPKNDTMEIRAHYPLLITSPGLSHIAEIIFMNLDYKSLMHARATCKAWYDFIESCPKLWHCVVLSLRRSYLLIHPFWKQMQEKIPKKDYILLCKQLMHYKWELFKNDWCGLFYVGEQHCICIIYGDLRRLEFFWPYIKDSRHPKQVLHFAAYFGIQDVLEFLVNELKDFKEYFNGRIDDKNGHTPLHIAAIEGHLEIVKTLLPFYSSDPKANGKTSLFYALEKGYTQMAHCIEKWFTRDFYKIEPSSKRMKLK